MVYSLHERLILGIVYEYLFVLTSGFTSFTSISTQFSCFSLHNFLLCFIWSTPEALGSLGWQPSWSFSWWPWPAALDVHCVSKPAGHWLTLLRSRAELSEALGDGVASTCLLMNAVGCRRLVRFGGGCAQGSWSTGSKAGKWTIQCPTKEC